MPNHETFDGEPRNTYNYRGWQTHTTKPDVNQYDFRVRSDNTIVFGSGHGFGNPDSCSSGFDLYGYAGIQTLSRIGLLDALHEVEAVLAWNAKEKHIGDKWKSKSIAWHDSKAISHLSKSQLENKLDEDTGLSHRAHAACRMLMSLAHELEQSVCTVEIKND